MSKRIGERLVEKGLITPVQLDRALQTQLILGGHVGTCLIELGFVETDAFGEALAEMHGLSHAASEELEGIPEEVLRIFDPRMVEKYRAIPLRLEDKTLHLAVIDPKTLGRLSSITGYKLIPWITPETRLLEAMETYYGIERSARYVRLSEGLVRPVPEEPAPAPTPGSPGVSRATEESAEIGSELGVDLEYGTTWRDVAGDLFDEATTGDQKEEDGPADDRDKGPGRETVYEKMARVGDKTELASIVLGYLVERMSGAALFSVRGGTASLWDWSGMKLDRERAASLRFPVMSGSIFELMLGEGQYRGEVPDTPSSRWFYAALGVEPPEEILLLPVYLNDRLIAVVYGDGGASGEIRGSTELFKRLAHKLGLGLSMLVLKIKIAS